MSIRMAWLEKPRFTAESRSQVVDSLGRRASRTSTRFFVASTIGSTEVRPYQLRGKCIEACLAVADLKPGARCRIVARYVSSGTFLRSFFGADPLTSRPVLTVP